MDNNKTFIEDFEEVSNSFKALFSQIEKKLLLLKKSYENVNAYIDSIQDTELRATMRQTSNEIFGNYQNVLSKILFDQTNIQDKSYFYIEDFFLKSQEYNANWVSQLNNALKIEHDSLKKRSIESLKKEMHNFYGIFKISLSKYL